MTEPKATYSDLPVCALCGCHPVNYHTGAFGVKHYCVDRHCTLHNVLFTESEWRNLMGEPEGFVLVPRELTAENGAKAALMGEFSQNFPMYCWECHNDFSGDELCQACLNTGEVMHQVNISWTVIKEIWKKAIQVVGKTND